MISRRDMIKSSGVLAGASFLKPVTHRESATESKTEFKYCLNTSTISGQEPGLTAYIDIAAEAGYDAVELWVRDVKAWLDKGNKAGDLQKRIEDKGLVIANAIGFAPWLVEGEENKTKGFQIMKEEMEIMKSLGGTRIAAAPAGVSGDKPLDLFMAGERYAELLELGRKTGVMPQLEFWGASKALWHFGQLLMIVAVANDPDVHLLPDIYHLFRGDSGFEGLKLLQGNVIEVFHVNDYPGNIARTEQQDKDRVYPGDGVAPVKEIFTTLSGMGGTKYLSVELFNREYWKQDALLVAKTALEKTRSIVKNL